MGLIILIVVVFDISEKIDDFIDAGLPVTKAFSYFILKIPFILTQITPVGILLSVLVVFGLMAKNNEMVALKSSGISVYYLLVPVLLMGFLVSVFLFVVSEVVVPITMEQANQIWRVQVRQETAMTSKEKNIWIKGKRRISHIKYYDQATERAHVNPYDDGHLKVIAALTLSLSPESSFTPTDSVDDFVAVTNLVKFSFYRESKDGSRLDVNPPKGIYDVMWTCYSKYETELLQPDIIIGVGNDVTAALRRGLRQDGKDDILIKVPFPGRLNLNSRWVPRGRRLIKVEHYNPELDKASIRTVLRGTPDREGPIHRAIETDWYYFREVRKCLMEKVPNIT